VILCHDAVSGSAISPEPIVEGAGYIHYPEESSHGYQNEEQHFFFAGHSETPIMVMAIHAFRNSAGISWKPRAVYATKF
jgi:hypothetical protein